MPPTRCQTFLAPSEQLQSRLRVTTISPKSRYWMPVRALAATSSRKCSNRFFRQNRRAWEWVCPLRAQLLKLTMGSYGRRIKPAAARFFVSDCRSHDGNNELLPAGCDDGI